MHTFMLLAIFLIELNFLISFLYKLIPQEKYDQTSPSQGKKKASTCNKTLWVWVSHISSDILNSILSSVCYMIMHLPYHHIQLEKLLKIPKVCYEKTLLPLFDLLRNKNNYYSPTFFNFRKDKIRLIMIFWLTNSTKAKKFNWNKWWQHFPSLDSTIKRNLS